MPQLNTYQDFAEQIKQGDINAWTVFHLQHLFLSCCEYDLLTGQGLNLDLISLLERMHTAWFMPPHVDRLNRIAKHCHTALMHLLNEPHATLQREHILQPFQTVREIDSKSMLWISKQPGSTVAEKLKSSPKIKALHKRWVLDSAENQLLKAFVSNYADMLELKREALDPSLVQFMESFKTLAPALELKLHPETEHINAYLEFFEQWLLQDAVREIRPWRNLPPNNKLLSGKDYRRIWDAWTWIQNLDDDISKDEQSLGDNLMSMVFMGIASHLQPHTTYRFEQLPCFFHMRTLQVTLSDLQNTDFKLQGRMVSESGQGYALTLKLKRKQHELSLQVGNLDHGLSLSLSFNPPTQDQSMWTISLAASRNGANLLPSLEQMVSNEFVDEQTIELAATSLEHESRAGLEPESNLGEESKLQRPLPELLTQLEDSTTSTESTESTANATEQEGEEEGLANASTPPDTHELQNTQDSEDEAVPKAQSLEAQLLWVLSNSVPYLAAPQLFVYAWQLLLQVFPLESANQDQDAQESMHGSMNGLESADTSSLATPDHLGLLLEHCLQEQEAEEAEASEEAKSKAKTQASLYNLMWGYAGAQGLFNQEDAEEILYDLVSIELTSIRPDYALNSQQVASFTQNHLSQVWEYQLSDQDSESNLEQKEVLQLNYALASALQISKLQPLISWLSLYQHQIDDTLLSQSSQLFFEHIAHTLPCRNLWALVPDSVEEFALHLLRQQLKLQFAQAQTLPRSIGAIFALMLQDNVQQLLCDCLAQQHSASPNANHNPNANGSTPLPTTAPQSNTQQGKSSSPNSSQNQSLMVIVASLHGFDLELTPIVGYYHEEDALKYKECFGWSWERYPTSSHKLDETVYQDVLNEALQTKLDQDPLNLLKQAFSPSDLVKLAGDFSFLNGDNNAGGELTPQLVEPLQSMVKPQEFEKLAAQACGHIKGKQSVQPYILRTSSLLPATSLDLGLFAPVLGAQHLASLQALYPEHVFWKDHLPSLILMVKKQSFELVKDVKIEPMLGKKIEIMLPANQDITLPAHQSQYQFKLKRSQVSELDQLQYRATLQSAQFPLPQDLKCHMRLFYTYGADNPYELWFVANEEGANKFPVKWTPLSEVQQLIPDFPPDQGWSSLPGYRYQDKLTWLIKILRRIYSPKDLSNLKTAEHYDQFKKGLNQIDFMDIYHCCNGIWLAGRSITDPDADPELVYFFNKFCADLTKELQNKDLTKHHRKIFSLASTNKDLPEPFWVEYINQAQHINDLFKDKITGHGQQNFNYSDLIDLLRNSDRFGYAIGRLDLPQQKELWDKLLQCLNNSLSFLSQTSVKKCMNQMPYKDSQASNISTDYGLLLVVCNLLRSVTIALWRYDKLIETLSVQSINTISNLLMVILEKLLLVHYKSFLTNQTDTKKQPLIPQTGKIFVSVCELMLALTRTRNLQDPSKQKLWSLSSPLVEKAGPLLYDLLELYEQYKDQTSLNSYLRLESSQGSSSDLSPKERSANLLPCTINYVLCEDPNSTIKISGLNAT